MSEKLLSTPPPLSSQEIDLIRRSIYFSNDFSKPPSPPIPSATAPPDIQMSLTPPATLPSDISMSDCVAALPHSMPLVSYKSKLVENESGKSFDFAPDTFSYESDEEEDDGKLPFIRLSKADKMRMYSPWLQSVIVKTFGKNVGYNFLLPRVKAQWKPIGKMDCVDIGDDFFIFKFDRLEDYHRVLSGGPWFVGPSFLTVRKWEPQFSTSSAMASTTAVWAQLPQLPTDCYDAKILEQIGRILGKPLRIDAHTAHRKRGRFARICIEVDLSKPLITEFKISKHKQRVQYEGISALCFDCGRIGHRALDCRMKDLAQSQTPESNPTLGVLLAPRSCESPSQEGMGPWVKVEPKNNRKKLENRAPENQTPAPPAVQSSGKIQHPLPPAPISIGTGDSRPSEGAKPSTSAGPTKTTFNASQKLKGPAINSQNGRKAFNAPSLPPTVFSHFSDCAPMDMANSSKAQSGPSSQTRFKPNLRSYGYG